MVIGMIGVGNMGAAFARGLAESDDGPDKILLADERGALAKQLAEDIGGESVDSNIELAKRADLVVLCVKPAQLGQAASDINEASKDGEVTVASILGATTIEDLQNEFAEGVRIMRLMPNIAVESRRGFIAYCASATVDDALKDSVIDQIRVLGDTFEVEEESIDAITAVGSCSPAFFCMAAESIADAGVEQGLSQELSRKLVAIALAGTGEMLRRRGDEAGEIMREVASPGGSTEVGMKVLVERQVDSSFKEAVAAAVDKCQESKQS